MPAAAKIELTPEAEHILASLQALPTRITNYICAAMDQENLLTASHIQAAHLTGQGPFPVEEHKLGVRTGRLRQSVTTSKAVLNGSLIVSAIGSNVKYARIHEFGGQIHKPARQQKIRHRLDARGNLVKQITNSNLLVFARADHKRVREQTVDVEAHDITIPERAPFRTGIAECLPNYKRTISAHIVEAWKGLK